MSTQSRIPETLAGATAAVAGVLNPSRTQEADTAAEQQFQESFVYRAYLEDDSVHITVREGVATLSGTVADTFHKRLAEETALSVPGVGRVENKLETEAEAAAENSDLWIAGKVRLALLLHRNVSAIGTNVDVYQGIVTLSGEATSLAQKELTGEYAADIEGVVRVVNNITVVPAPAKPPKTLAQQFDDASIVAQVRVALRSHRSTSTVETGVTAHNGVVALTGIARNGAERSLIGKLAGNVRGVTYVRNEMTVRDN